MDEIGRNEKRSCEIERGDEDYDDQPMILMIMMMIVPMDQSNGS